MSSYTKGLVSVGVPTFNRPEGLRRTLAQLTAQTYPDLEIIVSDNASPNEQTREVAEEFAAHDERVRYIRQPVNMGAAANFDFVLRQGRGEFFMWAADDDEWHPEFVEKCLENIGSAVSAVSGSVIWYRVRNYREPVAMPPVNPRLGTYQNLKLFLASMAPGFIYGVHRRENIEWVLSETQFDWWDCYFVARQIARGGFATYPDVYLTLGIDTEFYVLKPFHPRKGRVFRYVPFLRSIAVLLVQTPELSLWQKLAVFNVALDYMANAFAKYESEARPSQVRVVRKLHIVKWYLLQAFARARRWRHALRRALEGGRSSAAA